MSDYLSERRKFIEAGRPLKVKEKKYLNKVSPKRQKKIDEQREAGTDSGMDLFFQANRSKMTGRCLFCNGNTMKKDDEKFHFSLAHLLPKATFKSVATHPDILIELCFFGESCHTNFDNGKITWEFIKDSKEWEIIKEKLLNVLPVVAQEERKNKLYEKLCNLVYEK